MINEVSGDLLRADVEALVNAVNTVGVMGKGIALQFKRAYPENFRAYQDACRSGLLRLGHVFVQPSGHTARPNWILNFPTKGHWRAKSRIADIEIGLDDLVCVIDEREIRSVAIPPLGCGNGGLSWSEVRDLTYAKLSGLRDVAIHLYLPQGEADALTTSPAQHDRGRRMNERQ